MYNTRLLEVMEKGSEHFDAIEQCLEERATVLQLSELSAKLDALVSRIENLEDENTELKKQVCSCERGSQEHPIPVEDDSDSGLSYTTPEESEVLLPVPITVLPAVSGQHCKPSRNHLISLSRSQYLYGQVRRNQIAKRTLPYSLRPLIHFPTRDLLHWDRLDVQRQ